MNLIKFIVLTPALLFSLNFSRVPTLTQTSGGVWQVEFAVDQATDVEVSIISMRDNSIVRRLGAGMLGANPPKPFLANSLHQTLDWDGKGDYGEAVNVPTESLTVRVRAGMTVQYDNMVGNDPYTFCGAIRGMVSDTNGFVYIYGAVSAAGGLSLRKYDKNGDYVRTLFPSSSSLPSGDVSGFGINLTANGNYSPKNGSSLASPRFSPLVIGGINFNHSGEFGRSTSLVVLNNDTDLGFLGMVNTWMSIKTDGTRPGTAVEMPLITYPALPSDAVNRIGGIRFLCASPDGKNLYLTGLWEMKSGIAVDTGLWRDGQVFKINRATGVATPIIQFTAVPTTLTARAPSIGCRTENFRFFSSIHGMSMDDSGRLYICDRLHSRIGVYDTTGLYLGGIPLKYPEMVQVNSKSGEVYAINRAVTGSNTGYIKLYKYATWRNTPAPVCSVLVSTDVELYGEAAYLTAVRNGGTTRLWIAHNRMKESIRIYQDDGSSFSPVKSFSSPAQKLMTAFDRLAVDRKSENVFVCDANGSIGRISDWQNPAVVACTLSNGSRLTGVDISVSPSGLLYVQSRGDCGGPLARFTLDRYLKPAKFSNSESNILAGTVSRNAMSLNGYRGLGISSEGRVAVFSRAPAGNNHFIASLADTAQPVYETGTYYFPKQLDTMVKLHHQLTEGGIRFDAAGNLYVGISARSKNHKRPAGFENDWAYSNGVGCIAKIPAGAKGAQIGVRTDLYKIDTLPEDKSIGYERFYEQGYGPFSVGGGIPEFCSCRSPRFDIDNYGRLFIPNAITQKVAVVDNNGNTLANFGEYGNMDSKGNAGVILFCWPVGAAASDDFIYVTDFGNSRLTKVRMEYTLENIHLTTGAFSESSNRDNSSVHINVFPNPFNPVCAINLNLPSTRNIRLDVYAADGRFICNLASGKFIGGRHAFVWKGVDNMQKKVSAGIYVYRLTAGNKVFSVKGILTK